jgi:Tol biopolymer transport system component
MMSIQWLGGSGRMEPLLTKPGAYSNPRISPDGKKLALLVANEQGSYPEVAIYDTQRDAMTRLTTGWGRYGNPVWSPDGRYLVFGVDMFSGSPESGIFWSRADGPSHPQPLIQGKLRQHPSSFSPDGKRLAYTDTSSDVPHIWTVSLEDGGEQLRAGKPEEFLRGQFGAIPGEAAAMFSPDGRWLAYQESDKLGRFRVYVRPFPPPPSGEGRQWLISNDGGTEPVWSRTGHELLYRSGNEIMAVSYTVQGDSFVAEKARVWASDVAGPGFDLAPDGKRVAVLTPVESPGTFKAEHEVVFLLNFSDYLRQRMPAGNR